ncbi:MAG TPA: glycosyltransferase family 4 protein, partial [Kofleriaceae bacterium]|nr:glycosyltransferase family 4 protein [Kofleriaceae bacterium]
LVPIKGVDVAIDAMTHVGTNIELVIAGDGPERAALESRVARIAPSSSRAHVARDRAAPGQRDPVERVHFVGQLDATARDELLGRASLVVVPSRVLPNGRSEGTPLVALEALAAGVPVIASDVGGLRELDAIVRVPPDDPRALAAAIDRVLASPPDGDELRASISHLSWPRVAQRLLDFTLDRLVRA